LLPKPGAEDVSLGRPVAPREVLETVGLLDERFVGAFFEDNDYLAR
jgi:hypothetical protein